MVTMITEMAKYLIILFAILYSVKCFTIFGTQDQERHRKICNSQVLYMLVIHFLCNTLLYLQEENINIVFFYAVQLFFFIFILSIFTKIYPTASRLLTNNMCFLLMMGFVIVSRISYDEGIRQFIFAAVGTFIILVIPMFIEKMHFLQQIHWIYGSVGLVVQASLLVIGSEKYGAKNWISIGSFSFQPSEFVKILFIFFIAAMFAASVSKGQILLTTVIVGMFVIVYVLERDLGTALLIAVTYLVMLYIATSNGFLFYGGLAAGSAAAYLAFQLFPHVKVRVAAWSDPFADIDHGGWQIILSMFAIGTGGWIGLGLGEGKPGIIPVVISDMIFSAIAEELGGIVALCLILVYLSCFFMFITIAMKIENYFYKYIGVGLSVAYIFQVFLNIGGATKFIPLTGVTLPLISAGGTSILATIIIFGIIQGLYVLNQSEVKQYEEEYEPERDRYYRTEQKQEEVSSGRGNPKQNITSNKYPQEILQQANGRKIKSIRKVPKNKKY